MALNGTSSAAVTCEPFAYETLEKLGWFFCIFNLEEFFAKSSYLLVFFEVIPIYLTIVFIDLFICFLSNENRPRVNMTISSIGITTISLFTNLIIKGMYLVLGLWINRNLAIIQLSRTSTATWILAVVLTDLGIYWAHRAQHEINFLWADHQVHHMHDTVNMAMAARVSVFDPLTINLPAVFWSIIMPYEVLYIAFRCIVLWITLQHRNFLKNLGPLEYVLVSPRLHHVHHGVNRYCIDKNFAFGFILWDRIFGTYADPRPDEPVNYGLTKPVNSYNFLTMTYVPFAGVFKKVAGHETKEEKAKSLLYGPGWETGKPRLGCIEDVPENPPPIYDPPLSFGLKLYLVIHGLVNMLSIVVIASVGPQLLQMEFEFIFLTSYIILTAAAFGLFLDKSRFAPLMEIIRCSMFPVIYNVIVYKLFPHFSLRAMVWFIGFMYPIAVAFYGLSAAFWFMYLLGSAFAAMRANADGKSDNNNVKTVEEEKMRPQTDVEVAKTDEEQIPRWQNVVWIIFGVFTIACLATLYSLPKIPCGYSLDSVYCQYYDC